MKPSEMTTAELLEDTARHFGAERSWALCERAARLRMGIAKFEAGFEGGRGTAGEAYLLALRNINEPAPYPSALREGQEGKEPAPPPPPPSPPIPVSGVEWFERRLNTGVQPTEPSPTAPTCGDVLRRKDAGGVVGYARGFWRWFCSDACMQIGSHVHPAHTGGATP